VAGLFIRDGRPFNLPVLLNKTFHIQQLSNQQREPGKKSRLGGAAESEQLPPTCIAFTFYPGGGLSLRQW